MCNDLSRAHNTLGYSDAPYHVASRTALPCCGADPSAEFFSSFFLLGITALFVLQAVGSLTVAASAPAAVFRRKPAAPQRTAPTAVSAPAPAGGAPRDPAAGTAGQALSGKMTGADSDDSEDDVPLSKLFGPDRWPSVEGKTRSTTEPHAVPHGDDQPLVHHSHAQTHRLTAIYAGCTTWRRELTSCHDILVLAHHSCPPPVLAGC